MKKTLLVVSLLLPVLASAQKLEWGIKAGISANTHDLGTQPTYETRQAWGMGYAAGIRGLVNFSHFQAGLSVEALSAYFKSDARPVDGPLAKTHFQPAITPAVVFNYKTKHAYVGVDVAPAFTNFTASYSGGFGPSYTAHAFEIGYMGGIHVGTYLHVSKHWSLNPELGVRYYKVSKSGLGTSTIAIPLTIGIMHSK